MTSVLSDQWVSRTTFAEDGALMQPKLLPFTGMACNGVAEVDVQRLNQKFNKRMVLAYRFKSHAEQPHASVVGKLYRHSDGEQVYREMAALWASGFTAMPAPLGYLPELNMVVQAAIPGQPLKMQLPEPDAPSCIRQFAQTLAAFHSSPHQPRKHYDLQRHLLRCHPRHEVLMAQVPGTKTAINTFIRAASQRMADPSIQQTPIHADLHLKQAHVNAQGCWLLDFDSLGWGDPAADLGNVLVFLKAKSRKVPQVDRLIETFLETYVQRMGAQILQRVPLYEALTCLRSACKQYRLQPDGWQPKVHHLLDQMIQHIHSLR